MTITCSIHQPNFFPWLGYFDKIKRSDIFVFLDHVQTPKKGSSWFNRTQLRCFDKEIFYTCPINRPSGVITIHQTQFSDPEWKVNFMAVLKNYYRNSPNCSDVCHDLSGLIHKKDYEYLADLNKDIIVHFSKYFGYAAQFVSSTNLGIKTKATEMLIDICKQVGADVYLCGGGASGYQKDELFEKKGIDLIYQNFVSEPYGNPENYLPGLSIIDYLMSVK
jgi:hypothetical protein